MFEVRSGELVARLGGELLGNAELVLRGIASLEAAGAQDISFLSSAKHLALLQQSAAGCVIVGSEQREAVAGRPSAIVVADPYLHYARLTQWWATQTRQPAAAGMHPSAVVESGARVHAEASIGALAHVAAGAWVGRGAVIGPQCHVGAHAVIGEYTRLAAQVVVGERCRIGARCILHGGAVIGADGFGFAPVDGRWEKIEQLGAVDIGDDVEIGANSCVDRGALQDTVLERGVKLDNLVHIAHNVVVGAHTAMAACVGIAGSTRIGAHCTFAGQAGVVGHVSICDHVHIGAACAVTRSITKPGSYGGMFPFDENGVWDKNAATLRQLYALRGRVRALESKHT
ncbi:MAG: UDP-3-O-(3-hydroxymyristoyl)glucosamine N-acyltransferase [Burkholderiaceae bacterium]|jgi:UDP-3-O-[3-hydroxymyristoyl] glucosamine N-acyltransferase|nr:UDP-3-O-(3-hydroxymyristoyl)glucosamine N-acyltransferase [Burkholderiaceae bacterium]MCU0964809.1 UDP-3-O-(3-hydroxymyristoyl)glucosamine N-acyltransferase [Burkholderiaceae bacterium]